jgi:hypothetical protein
LKAAIFESCAQKIIGKEQSIEGNADRQFISGES